MKRKLLIVVAIALFFRLYRLGSLPAGFHVDEVRAGWNAYSIVKTGADDKGSLLPLYYNTFGDYRPTGIFYVIIPSIIIFGLNAFAVRLPAAILGALTVIPVYYLTKELFPKNKAAPIFAALFLAVSPWHISASRATSEAVISMLFSTLGMYWILLGIRKARPREIWKGAISIVLSYFFYHTIRALAPLFVLALYAFNFKRIYMHRLLRVSFYSFFFVAVCAAVMLFSQSGRARLSQVSVVKDTEIAKVLSVTDESMRTPFDYPLMVYLRRAVVEYSKYFSAGFLIGDDAKPVRYKAPDFGLMTYSLLAFFVMGFFALVRKKDYLVLALLLTSPLASSITTEDSPNLHRSLVAISFFVIIAGYGAGGLYVRNKLTRSALYLLLGLLLFQWTQFGASYVGRAQYVYAHERNYGAYDLSVYLNEVHDNYEEVVVTSDPDDPYPWFAFYNKLDPREFNKHAFERTSGPWKYENILFTQSECPSGDTFPGKFDKPLGRNVLVVDGFKCPVESKIRDGMKAKVIKQILNPNGSTSYTFWERTPD